MSRVAEGKLGEKAACVFLSTKGFNIVERNWHCRTGEIDIVATDNNMLVFVEVKMRSNSVFGEPHEYITAAKLIKLKLAIASYIKFHRLGEIPWRLDAVGITKGRQKLHFRHFVGILSE